MIYGIDYDLSKRSIIKTIDSRAFGLLHLINRVHNLPYLCRG